MTEHCELCELLDSFGDEEAPVGGTVLWCDDRATVLLVDDVAHPGFCRVVAMRHVKEMTDMTAADRAHIMEVVWRVEQAQRDVLRPEKINLASLGNMTPHVHWHVIPRYPDDAQFPHPVWAAAQRVTPDDVLAARRALLPQLAAAIAQRLGA